MHEVVDEDAQRREALLSLQWFTTRLLRGQLRRHGRCRHRPSSQQRELLADLRQELMVDCLSHLDAVLALPPHERHRRWFRFVERWLYRELRRNEALPEHFEASAQAPLDEEALHGSDLPMPTDAGPRCTPATLRNGRTNVTATANAAGLTRRRVRALWVDLADRLGYDATFLCFWRRRLAEALTGLASDQLRDREVVHLLPRPRRRPDPRARLRRIRRILSILSVRPLPHDVRRAIAIAKLRRNTSSARPSDLMAAAAVLDAGRPEIALWRFEAAVADGELAVAARALVDARDFGADGVAVALARARLLAARGRRVAAVALLRRASDRSPHDTRLSAALSFAGQDPSPSARNTASPSSRSSFASERGEDHVGVVANIANPR
ncbi:MAG: hypothetical protein ABL997_00685 [Planctomycetota bacterium]